MLYPLSVVFLHRKLVCIHMENASVRLLNYTIFSISLQHHIQKF